MKGLLLGWIGQKVHVVLRSTIPTPISSGVLYGADETGIILEMPKGRTFIPMTSILHVSLLETE